MKNIGDKTGKGSLTRRDFTKKSIFVIASLGTAGLIGYDILNSKKIRTKNNMLRMGHCAPSIMQTLLDINGIQNSNMVLYAGAMAGGIAGANMECGALTSPLMFLGFQNYNPEETLEKLDLIRKAQSYVNRFSDLNGASTCSKIRSGGLSACRKVVYNFNKPFSKAISNPDDISQEAEKSYSFLLQAFDDTKFHCAHSVLNNLKSEISVPKELLDSSWIFIGGIAMLNRTCGALTAGVLALSSLTAKIENSYSRVARMNRLLKEGSNVAMDENINNFNRSINLGDELGRWFSGEFGHTSCFDIWGYDFSRPNDSENFVSHQCLKQCEYITKKVAEKVNNMI